MKRCSKRKKIKHFSENIEIKHSGMAPGFSWYGILYLMALAYIPECFCLTLIWIFRQFHIIHQTIFTWQKSSLTHDHDIANYYNIDLK